MWQWTAGQKLIDCFVSLAWMMQLLSGMDLRSSGPVLDPLGSMVSDAEMEILAPAGTGG